jgi:hypothetical protein
MARPAETDKVRRWNGVVANANDLEKFRVWVVWGLAAPPEHGAEEDSDLYPPGGPATDIAIEIAAENDAEFAGADDDHRWIMLVEGDESDVDEWVRDHDDASGYASYLLEAGRAHEGSDTEP